MALSSNIYTRFYSDMGGVDFSGEPSEISPKSFAYLENMYRDYGIGTGVGVETIPGFRRVTSLGGCVHALHPHPEDTASLLVHAGTRLYRLRHSERDLSPHPLPLTDRGGRETELADRKSRGVIMGGRLYLLDGESYRAVSEDTVTSVESEAYVPTVYSDGEPLEQANLLSARVSEEYHLLAIERYTYTSTEGFLYSVSNEGICLISGYEGEEETVILPTSARIGALEYTVSGVASYAFMNNSTIKTLVVSEGISILENGALFGMRALTTLVLPTTVAKLPVQCFDGCPMLHTLYLTRETRELGPNLCDASTILTLHYSGTAAELFEIDTGLQLVPLLTPEGFRPYYESVYETARYRFPLHLPTDELLSVGIDGLAVPPTGEELLWHPITGEGGSVEAVYLEVTKKRSIEGKTLSLSLRVSNLLPEALGKSAEKSGMNGASAINRCTLIAHFEDRLFLSGNPDLPGVVFYTHRRMNGESDPSYIGVYNSFTDGDGRAAVRAILPTSDTLIVLTDELPEHPSLFCHTGSDTGEDLVPRIYPLAEKIGGVGSVSEAATFFGENLFLSRHGLEAIEKAALYEERRTGHRSTSVDTRLLREDLDKATLFRFGSYLGIAVDGHVYLADGRRRTARNGHSEYEWYFLSGIGSHVGDMPRYRFVTGELPAVLSGTRVTVSGRSVGIETADEEGYADGLPLYSLRESDQDFTYAERDGHAILATTDGERYGGVFSPATAFCECEELLYFGTASGDLLVFNTDCRGEDGIIPRRYYSFCGHAYPSGCATKIDNCDLPNKRKSTVRSGGAVRLKSMTGGKLEVRVRTEEGSWTVADTLYGGRRDFGETDFASAEFHLGEDTVVPLREAKRRWIEKQLYFVSEEYQRPFGILSIAYQYRVAGRI